MGRVRRSFVSFAAQRRGSPLPPVHSLEGGPSAQDATNTSVSELRQMTEGSAEGDLSLVETEIAEGDLNLVETEIAKHIEYRTETGTLEVGDLTTNSQVLAPEIARLTSTRPLLSRLRTSLLLRRHSLRADYKVPRGQRKRCGGR